MAKSMDQTLEDLRREQASQRAAWEKQKEKPLTAITVALAEKESKNQTPRPDSSWQPSPQYGPYVDMQREYPITMAGMRLAEEEMKTAKTQQEQTPLTAITVALAEKESKNQTPGITMAGLRQAEQRLAPNMTMGGLKRAEKNEAGLQAAQQALARMSDKSQNSGTFDTSHLTLNKTISHYEKEIANEKLTPDLEAELKRALAMARNITETDPELAYAILEYVASKGQAIEYDFDLLREKQSVLQTWLTDLRRQSLRDFSKNSGVSQEAIAAVMEQQAIIDSELKKVEAQIRYTKTHEMKGSETEYPFYRMLRRGDKNSVLNNLAENIADYYQEIWYNIDENKAKQLWMNLYPALSTISIMNQAETDRKSESFPINLSNTAGKEAFSDLKNDRDVFTKDGYIIDQRKLTGVGYSLLGNSPGNGCGWISAYNALKVLGEEPEPYDIMREVESGALLAGLSGTDPLYLVRFFRSKGYDTEIYVTKEDVERETLRSDASILVYGYDYNGRIGAHFITGYPKQSEAGKMRFFNDGYEKEDYTGPIDAHYHDYDIFRFAICINKP
ncbi:MAG TPA: hypothetical protein VN366_08180 [Feifaniaceae bacterium]|nr:hypothetical protein [Feifaniaceae bacterium]